MQVLQAYYGVEDGDLWQLVTGLGSGIARRQFICGAFTGGVLACGLVTARRRKSTREDRKGLREDSYTKVQELARRFEAQFGTVSCREMIGCDLLTPEGQAAFKQTGMMDGVCRPAVRFAVESVIDLMDQ